MAARGDQPNIGVRDHITHSLILIIISIGRVSFQEVVHSVLTEEAEVAEASDPQGELNG